MNTIQRSGDVIFSTEMEDLGGLEKFPVYMGCVSHPQSEDIYADMLWHISPSNGLLQLKNLIPLEVLYPENHNAAVGAIWMKHHQSFASFIREVDPSSVLEIGGAHGILSKLYHQTASHVDWTILEPNPVPVQGVSARFIKGFFDDNFTLDKPVDAIVHSHVLEHIYDPKSFLKNTSKLLETGKYLIFSIPNMKEMLKRKYTNCINFEHSVFITEPYVDYLLNRYGFKVLKREYFMDDHSIYFACIRTDNISKSELPTGLYEENKRVYLEYVSYHEKLIHDLNNKLAGLHSDQKIFLFGAHVFAQYLVAFGLNTCRIECLLDNDVNKQGKRLYGTNLHVASPTVLRDIESPVVILKAGAYNEEIKQDIIDNINKNTCFI